MEYKGKIWCFDDNVDTDMIVPARYLNISDHSQLAKYCFADVRPEFPEHVKKGDIIIAGNNFGCGSSREHAPIAIKASGISVIIAKSFARIFYRNAINIGMPILECDEASNDIDAGDEISVDFSKGEIKNITKNKIYQATPFPPFVQDIMECGGLVEKIKKSV